MKKLCGDAPNKYGEAKGHTFKEMIECSIIIILLVCGKWQASVKALITGMKYKLRWRRRNNGMIERLRNKEGDAEKKSALEGHGIAIIA